MNSTLRALLAPSIPPLLAVACLSSACSTLRPSGDDAPVSVIAGPVEELTCDESGTVRSADSVGRITLLIHNRGAEPLSLFWINYDGEEENYGTIAAGEAAPVNTYFTHPWVLRDPAGDCVAAYVSGDTADISIESVGR